MRLLERAIVFVLRRRISRGARDRILRDMRNIWIQKYELANRLAEKIEEFRRTPLREREKKSDYMRLNIAGAEDTLRKLRKEIEEIQQQIEAIDPTFPIAKVIRKR